MHPPSRGEGQSSFSSVSLRPVSHTFVRRPSSPRKRSAGTALPRSRQNSRSRHCGMKSRLPGPPPFWCLRSTRQDIPGREQEMGCRGRCGRFRVHCLQSRAQRVPGRGRHLDQCPVVESDPRQQRAPARTEQVNGAEKCFFLPSPTLARQGRTVFDTCLKEGARITRQSRELQRHRQESLKRGSSFVYSVASGLGALLSVLRGWLQNLVVGFPIKNTLFMAPILTSCVVCYLLLCLGHSDLLLT